MTESQLQELRLAYVGNVREVSANLNRIVTRTGIPKKVLQYAAHRRGWRSISERKPWTPTDVEYLQEKVGTVSITQIARNLGRKASAVHAKIGKLSLSRRISEGYNVSNLCEVFGVHHAKVESWSRRGLLGKPHGHGGYGGDIRFTEANVVRFIREHVHEYDLTRVDQMWFKSMVFGSLAHYGDSV